MTDRTLDQQCTVTRPGIAAIASALLVEVLVSVLQHPLGHLAPAPLSQTEDRGSHPLGIVPHQIRGFLSSFQNMIISGKSYDCCSACSDKVVNSYAKEGWEFVKKVLNQKGYVEELSGLADVGQPFMRKDKKRLIICRFNEQRRRQPQTWTGRRAMGTKKEREKLYKERQGEAEVL